MFSSLSRFKMAFDSGVSVNLAEVPAKDDKDLGIGLSDPQLSQGRRHLLDHVNRLHSTGSVITVNILYTVTMLIYISASRLTWICHKLWPLVPRAPASRHSLNRSQASLCLAPQARAPDARRNVGYPTVTMIGNAASLSVSSPMLMVSLWIKYTMNASVLRSSTKPKLRKGSEGLSGPS